MSRSVTPLLTILLRLVGLVLAALTWLVGFGLWLVD
jgi:hypothetical protein